MTASRPVVLVVGPPLAGVSSVGDALRQRIPDVDVVEAADGAAADVVVFAVSAVAPMTASDRRVLERAIEHAGGGAAVVAVVTKVDAHRAWRDVLASDRVVLADGGPRYREVPWVGVAAAPDLGEPRVGDLVAAVRRGLAAANPDERRRRRSADSRARLRHVVADHRRERSAHALALRAGIQQARVSLAHGVRTRSARMAAELRAEAAALPRTQTAEFETRVRQAAAAFATEVDERIDRAIVELANQLAQTPVAAPTPAVADLIEPMLTSRRVENRLMIVLGAGFGLGVALASGRLVAGVADGLDVVGSAVGAVLGLVVAVWVVGVRGLLHTRAVYERWVVEVAAAARCSGEERVAVRLLAADLAWATAMAERDREVAARVARTTAAIDAELRATTP